MINFFTQCLVSIIVLAFVFAHNANAAAMDDFINYNNIQTKHASNNLKFNRFIVKFKKKEDAPAPYLQKYISERRIEKLKEKMVNGHQPGKRFFHLKSIAERSEVAVTETALTHREMYALVKKIEKDPTVDYVELDNIFQIQFEPNDTNFVNNNQWHLKSPANFAGGANLPQAWDISSGQGVVVAVIDTGYRPHPDLVANILPGYDFIADTTISNDTDGRDTDAQDPGDKTTATGGSSSWHGTHVAGTIAAVSNNGVGVAGVAFNAKILPVRVLGVGGGYSSDIAAGIRWAAGLSVPGAPVNSNKAKVLNLSLGSDTSCGNAVQEAINEVRAIGTVVVVATGNDGNKNGIGSPANCSGVIAVTAHTKSGDLANYANIGNGTSISAPGGGRGVLLAETGINSIYSTANSGIFGPSTDNYRGYQGTSMATPHVSGVAALLASANPSLKPDDIKAHIINSARPFPPGTYCAVNVNKKCGAGLLDAQKAIQQLNLQPSVSASHGGGIKATKSMVNLTGQTTINPVTSYEWTQISGPPVVINNPNAANASFTAPAVGADFIFKFKVNNIESNSVQLTVTTNTAPVLNDINPINVNSGDDVVFQAKAVDDESDDISYSISGQPPNSEFDVATGEFQWNTSGVAGTYNIVITPNDGFFSGNSKTTVIVVNPLAVNNPSGGGGGGGSFNILDALLVIFLLAKLYISQKRD